MLANQPDNLVVANNLIWLLDTHFGASNEALQLAEQLRQRHSIDELPTRLIDSMMTAYRKAARYEDAEQLIHEALNSKPNSAVLNFQAGLLGADIQDYITAITALERAVELGLSTRRQERPPFSLSIDEFIDLLKFRLMIEGPDHMEPLGRCGTARPLVVRTGQQQHLHVGQRPATTGDVDHASHQESHHPMQESVGLYRKNKPLARRPLPPF